MQCNELYGCKWDLEGMGQRLGAGRECERAVIWVLPYTFGHKQETMSGKKICTYLLILYIWLLWRLRRLWRRHHADIHLGVPRIRLNFVVLRAMQQQFTLQFSAFAVCHVPSIHLLAAHYLWHSGVYFPSACMRYTAHNSCSMIPYTRR